MNINKEYLHFISKQNDQLEKLMHLLFKTLRLAILKSNDFTDFSKILFLSKIYYDRAKAVSVPDIYSKAHLLYLRAMCFLVSYTQNLQHSILANQPLPDDKELDLFNGLKMKFNSMLLHITSENNSYDRED